MLKFTKLSASSLALIIGFYAGSTHAQDATYDVDADKPAVAEQLDEREEDMSEFFDAQKDTVVAPQDYTPSPDLNAREEDALLDRAESEMTEFNDIDGDDLAELDREPDTDAEPRLEKPSQIEADLSANCPLGTDTQPDGTCLAGPDWRIEE